MNTKKKAMKDLTVHRVDGVESPATGRQFIIMKSDDPAEILTNARELATASDALLKGLLANESLSVDEATGEAILALGEMLEVDATKAVTAALARHAALKSAVVTPDPTPEPEPTPDAAGTPEVLTTAALDAWLDKAQDKIVTATITALREIAVEESDPEPTPNVTKSRQLAPDGDTHKKITKSAPKLGEGMFANVVFGS